jgi:4-diphosphocytidyl-2-C-methyl-D-erythritol kinase
LIGEVRLRAFAKVNYALEVRRLRDDGYHEIASVLQSISLADEIDIERAKEGFELFYEPGEAGIGPPEENTVRKAWAILRELSDEELPVRIRLRKEIPAGAGLGGGSADAAATLYGLNELFGLGLNVDELSEAGLRIGADVPFCLSGGTALAEGVGEVLSSLPAPPDHHLVLAKPLEGADTGEVYRAYDERPPGKSEASVEPVVAALRSGELPALAKAIGNDLEPVTAGFVPEVAACRQELLRAGALGAAMTGTGTAVYGVFRAEDDVRSAATKLGASFVGVFKPVSSGVEGLYRLRYNRGGAGAKRYWGVAKWQGTGFWSRDRRFESCRPSPWPLASRTEEFVRAHV